MTRPLLTRRTIAALRRIELRAFATEGVTVGGEQWSVARPTGVGIAPKTLAALDPITARVYHQKPGTVRTGSGGTLILDAAWRMLLIAGTVQPGDVITSVADPDYSFDVVSIEPAFDYPQCELERRR
jgi:hypothetical protein